MFIYAFNLIPQPEPMGCQGDFQLGLENVDGIKTLASPSPKCLLIDSFINLTVDLSGNQKQWTNLDLMLVFDLSRAGMDVNWIEISVDKFILD